MNIELTHSFRVMPKHCNMHIPMIFGGEFFGEMDMAAAKCVKKLLFSSKTCEEAVTHKVEDLTFHRPAYLGDLIEIDAKILDMGKKSIPVDVAAYRVTKDGNELMATAKFVFISIENVDSVSEKPTFLPYKSHGLSLEKPRTCGPRRCLFK